MNIGTLIVGIIAIGFGVYTGYWLDKAPSRFVKMKGLERAYGRTKALLMLFILYTMLPLIMGIMMIILSIKR